MKWMCLKIRSDKICHFFLFLFCFTKGNSGSKLTPSLDIFHLYYLSVLAAKWEDLLKIVNRLRNGTSEYKPVIMKRKREERRERCHRGNTAKREPNVYRV